MEFDTLKFQEALSKKWKYKKLPKKLSIKIRDIYKKNVPEGLPLDGSDMELYSNCGTLISKGYDRIVIGDYGAFIEIHKGKCIKDNFKCKPGQEYRYKDPNFCDKVKYDWLTAKDESDVKIYVQKRAVDYADYKPFMVYVSPHEIKFKKEVIF